MGRGYMRMCKSLVSLTPQRLGLGSAAPTAGPSQHQAHGAPGAPHPAQMAAAGAKRLLKIVKPKGYGCVVYHHQHQNQHQHQHQHQHQDHDGDQWRQNAY